jgi:hypothetical protein
MYPKVLRFTNLNPCTSFEC